MSKESFRNIVLAVLVVLVLGLTAGVTVLYVQYRSLSARLENRSPSASSGRRASSSKASIPGRIDLEGPFYAEKNRGLMKAGSTRLDSTIGFRLTGPMTLTVLPGTYTSPSGQKYTLKRKRSFELQAHPKLPKSVALFLVEQQGRVDVRMDTTFVPGEGHSHQTIIEKYGERSLKPEPITGEVQALIGYQWLIVEPGETTLEDDQIPVFHVYRRER